MSDNDDDLPELGSLGQSARTKHLKAAKTTMIIVGILTLGANIFMAISAENFVQAAFDKELRNIPAGQIDQNKLAELKKDAVRSVQLTSFGFAALGVVFLVLGFLVYRAPVVTTATGLILYLAGWATSAAMDPTMIAKGIILKVIIIAALVRALKAAIEYQKEQAAVEAV